MENHEKYIMRVTITVWFAVLAAFLLILMAAVIGVSYKQLKKADTDIHEVIYVVQPDYSEYYRDDLIEALNRYRLNEGLSLLEIDSRLSHTACVKVMDLYESGIWSHRMSDGRLGHELFWDHKGFAGENLARGYAEIDAIIAAWDKSLFHQAIMVCPQAHYAGACYYEGYWVLHIKE